MSTVSRVISLRQICRYYMAQDIETRALDGIDLDIQAGEFVAVTGPSGSGKTTLLSIMGLLDRASSGEFFFEGTNVAPLSNSELARLRNTRIGLVFQSFNLIGDLSVLDNVALPLSYRRGCTRREREQRAREVLQMVEMDHRVGHYPAQISGGQQQRVAVARALVGSPAIILADEPTGNLDSRNSALVMSLLGSLNRSGVTIGMITHDEGCAAQASRVVTIADGRLREPHVRQRTEPSEVLADA